MENPSAFLEDVRECGLLCVLGSSLLLSCESSGMVKNWYDSSEIIASLTPLLNYLTCFRMYRRKASLHQRPYDIIVYIGIVLGCLARYIAMAAPDIIERQPKSSFMYSSLSFPNLSATHRRVFNIWSLVTN